MDRIQIQRLTVACIIGIFDYERVKKQDVIVDLTLFADLRKAGRTDNIADTIDYNALENNVKKFIADSGFFLLEKLADGIAQLCLEHPLVQRVVIRVEKPGAPVQAGVICVKINRRRKDYE